MLGLNANAIETVDGMRLLESQEPQLRNIADKRKLLRQLVSFNFKIAQKRGKLMQILLPVFLNVMIMRGIRTTSPDYVIPPVRFNQRLDPISHCVAGSKAVSFYCDDTVLGLENCDLAYSHFFGVLVRNPCVAPPFRAISDQF
jgi:hypothetical protein